MKQVSILNEPRARFKLTVTPTEVRIKIQKDMPNELVEYIVNRLKIIADSPELRDSTFTWRGSFNYNYTPKFGVHKISMYNSNKSEHITYEV